MMSAFGDDPNADLMDSPRGLHRSHNITCETLMASAHEVNSFGWYTRTEAVAASMAGVAIRWAYAHL